MLFANEVMLNKYGYPTTLRATAITLAVLTSLFMPLLKGRLPAVEQSSLQSTNWACLKKPLFWVYCTSNLAQGLGYFYPSLYLPSYATSIRLSSRSIIIGSAEHLSSTRPILLWLFIRSSTPFKFSHSYVNACVSRSFSGPLGISKINRSFHHI